MLFASGAGMKDVQMRIGHTRISTTMDIYAHVTKQSEENISNLLVSYLDEETDSEAQFTTDDAELEFQSECKKIITFKSVISLKIAHLKITPNGRKL